MLEERAKVDHGPYPDLKDRRRYQPSSASHGEIAHERVRIRGDVLEWLVFGVIDGRITLIGY